MIVIDICCDREHVFEGWFASAEEFERQKASGMVACPVCGSSGVRRKPSAAYINSPGPARKEPAAADPEVLAKGVASVLRAMAARATDVGDRFPEEARRIHNGEADARHLRGRATRTELEELLDEGIAVLPVPPDDDLH